MPIVCSYSKSQEILRLVDNIVDKIFTEENIFIRTLDDYKYQEDFYRDNIFPSNKMEYFLSFSDGLFLSDKLFDRLMKRYKIDDMVVKSLNNILIMQRHSIKELSDVITLNTSSYFNFMKSKQISLGGYSFDLQNDEFDEYINDTFSCIENFSNKIYNMVSPSSKISFEMVYPFNFFISYNAIVIKKPVLYGSTYNYTVSYNHDYIANMKVVLSSLRKSFFSETLTHQELQNSLLSNYKAIKLIDENKLTKKTPH